MVSIWFYSPIISNKGNKGKELWIGIFPIGWIGRTYSDYSIKACNVSGLKRVTSMVCVLQTMSLKSCEFWRFSTYFFYLTFYQLRQNEATTWSGISVKKAETPSESSREERYSKVYKETGAKWGQLIAILTSGIVQWDKANAKRKSIHQKEKSKVGVCGMCMCLKERARAKGRVRREKHTGRYGLKLSRDSFSSPPNHQPQIQTSSHTPRYCHKAIPFFQKWFKKRLKNRGQFFSSVPLP